VPKDHSRHSARIRTNSDPNPDLTRALGDEIREHALEPHDREQRGKQREHAEQDKGEPTRRNVFSELAWRPTREESE